MTLSAGGYDNVTVGLCQIAIEGKTEAKELENTLLSRPVKKSRNPLYLLIVLILLSILCYVLFPDEISSIWNKIRGQKAEVALVETDALNVNDEV